MHRIQQGLEEKVNQLMKDMNRKLDKDEIDKLEKKYFAHVSKIFSAIQRFPDKDEMNKKFSNVEDQIRRVNEQQRARIALKASKEYMDEEIAPADRKKLIKN
jgi:GTP cyclohydrolase I